MNQGKSSPKNTQRAGVGKHIILELVTASGSERLEFDIVPNAYADFDKGFLGDGTPLAKTIEGLLAGQAAPYHVDDVKLVRVILVEPARSTLPKEIADRREETYRKAVEQSDRTNAMIFASSFSGKWGDYDPTGFVDEDDDKKKDEEV
ncbi:MAG: hypothetical protein EHM41_06015 [Chloroflexi bacterium]|nr:MAG: hypothetical protein EHM41_06015 [Chloroflexota bacterium]